jgi:predicted RNA binding protein YcfA (HicA-like mRNA interferase family)
VDRALRRLGFEPIRQRGSHVRYRHADGRVVTVPHHPGRDIARGTLRSILRYLDLSPDEFEELDR